MNGIDDIFVDLLPEFYYQEDAKRSKELQSAAKSCEELQPFIMRRRNFQKNISSEKWPSKNNTQNLTEMSHKLCIIYKETGISA